jgi:hypothetical protein
LSIQQDKRVVKPSKMSERYARWFETRVPSTSPIFRYLLMFCLSIPLSLLSAILLVSRMEVVLTMVIVPGFGVVIYLLYLAILRIRFQSTITDQQFSEIVESARSRVGANENVQIWPQKSANAYIASTFNFLFDAILISDTMIELVDQMPESGEALLAFHLSQAPRARNVFDVVLAFLPFFIGSSLISFVLSVTWTTPYIVFLIFFLIVISSSLVLFLPVLLVILLKAATWRHNSSFEKVTALYGIHPQVAKDEVMSSQKLDDEAARATVWVVREWERRKRSGRRNSIAILYIVLVFIIEYFYTMSFGLPYYSPYIAYISLLIYLPPFLVGLIVFVVLRRWDKKHMAEQYYTTKQADEPIWVD